MNEQEFAELAAGHALHALSPEDETRYREALAAHPEWEGVALADAAVAASLAEGAGRAAPPLTMRSTLLARIGSLPQEPRDAGAGLGAGAVGGAGAGAGAVAGVAGAAAAAAAGAAGALRRDRSGRAGDGDDVAGEDVAEAAEGESEAVVVEAEAVEAEGVEAEAETEVVEAETEVVEITAEATATETATEVGEVVERPVETGTEAGEIAEPPVETVAETEVGEAAEPPAETRTEAGEIAEAPVETVAETEVGEVVERPVETGTEAGEIAEPPAETEGVVDIDGADQTDGEPTDPLIALLGVTPDAGDVTAEPEAATTALPVERGHDAELPDEAPGRPATEPVPTTTAMQAVARRNWTRGLLALAACLTLLVGVGFGAGALYNWMNRPAAVVALDEIESAPDAQSATVVEEEGLTATVHWSEQLGKVVLVSDGLPSIPEDETFELWFVRGDEAISAGTFAPDGSAATTALEGEMQPGDVIAVTVEPAGGAPDGTPTSDPIVAVPTA